MLVLTRGLSETLIIGDDIKVTILGVNRGHVRIGIAAPNHVSIHREEVYNRIADEKAQRSSKPEILGVSESVMLDDIGNKQCDHAGWDKLKHGNKCLACGEPMDTPTRPVIIRSKP